MKLQEIKKIAKTKGISGKSLKKTELIRTIQKTEGNFDCYGSGDSDCCDQLSCLWREDCLDFSKN